MARGVPVAGDNFFYIFINGLLDRSPKNGQPERESSNRAFVGMMTKRKGMLQICRVEINYKNVIFLF
jgi:hypothetical protein